MSVSIHAMHLPLQVLGGSGGQDELFFFFLMTATLFLSNVRGLYCGKLLNFFSNSSSSFPSLRVL